MLGSLAVDCVDVSYGDTQVLKGVSLDVAPGEFVALLGASGCGKTTLLRSISGFVGIDRGRITVSDRDLTGMPPEKRGMAMVFQSYALWPHMSVAKNIGYGLKLRNWNRERIAGRVEEMLTLLSLEGLGDRNVERLSGGQRQRVALGRALAIEPEVLLLDEPLSNLDARIRLELRHEIRALQKRLGITAIHVTHDREEAMVMADRIAIMRDGSIAQIGAPEEIYGVPNSPFVADFLGASNICDLVVARDEGAMSIQAGPDNTAARLSPTQTERLDNLNGGLNDGLVQGQFHTNAARLGPPEDPSDQNTLVLFGRIAQRSYPGGFFRYAVAVGRQSYVVDADQPFSEGDKVGIQLPVDAIHLYPHAGNNEEREGTSCVN